MTHLLITFSEMIQYLFVQSEYCEIGQYKASQTDVKFFYLPAWSK